MLDFDDLDFAILASPIGAGLFLTLISIAIIVFIYMAVLENDGECKKKHCNTGMPVLIENDCHCLEKAK